MNDPDRRLRPGLTRRVFLGTLSAAVMGAALFVYPNRVGLYRWLLALDPDADSGTGTLSGDELATLIALGEVLYPSEFAADGEHAAMGRGVTRRFLQAEAAEVPGMLAEYRRAVRVLDGRGRDELGEPFSRAALPLRRRLVDDLLAEVARAGRLQRVLACLRPAGRDRWRLWIHVARPMLEGFYRSEAGWRVVGYPFTPGQCSDIEYYQFPPGRIG